VERAVLRKVRSFNHIDCRVVTRAHNPCHRFESATQIYTTTRVCALTRAFDNHLLWAHYAGGYTGVAIEIEIDDADVAEVTYGDNFIFLSDLINVGPPETAARQMLTRKYKDWKYEM
jgi:hypothetical protein